MENSTWTEMKSKIKTRWNKLTDENIDSLKGNMENLKDQLETTYGYSKAFAIKEYNHLMGKDAPSSTIAAKPPDAAEVKVGATVEPKKSRETESTTPSSRLSEF